MNKLKVIFIIFLLCNLTQNNAFSQSLPASPPPLTTSQQPAIIDKTVLGLPNGLDFWAKYYYFNKDFKRSQEYVKAIEEGKILEKNNYSNFIAGAYLSGLIDENAQFILPMMQVFQSNEIGKKFHQTAMLYADLGQPYLDKYRETNPNVPKHLALTKINIQHPIEIDFLLSRFFATGDSNLILKILSTLDKSQPLTGKEEMDLAIRQYATWALNFHMSQHTKIEYIVRSNLDKQPDYLKQLLNAIFLQHESYSPRFPNSKDGFGGMLALINQSGLDAFNNPQTLNAPVGQAATIKMQSKTKRDEQVFIKVMFGHIQLNEKQRGKVSFDVEFIDPEGKKHAPSAMKNLLALDSGIPNKFNIFNNNITVPSIAFDKTDKIGKYTFFVTLRDEIGNKQLKLEQTIELVE